MIKSILRDNLELVNDTYIILNVIEHESNATKPVCIGEIGSFQADQNNKYAVSNSSTTSELQSDQTIWSSYGHAFL